MEISHKRLQKKKEILKHDTTLIISAWGVEYGSIEDLNRDYNRVMAQFGSNHETFLRSMNPKFSALEAFPIKKQVIIHDKKPSQTELTFRTGVPLISTKDKVSVVVLYAPDYIPIGSIDNSNSDSTTSYSVSTTQGFTFSTSQKVSASLKISASAVVVTAEASVGLELSFTESWNSSTTETSSFSVPPGKKAFIYKGVLRTVILDYNPKDNSYSFGEDVLSTTNNLMVSRTPLAQN